jgi:hypothetical protein
MVLFATVRRVPKPVKIPAALYAVFPVIALLMRVSVPPLAMPPPKSRAAFRVIVLFITVTTPG